METVKIPKNLEHIEYGAFDSKGVTEIIWNNEIKSIGESAFKNCRITNLILPNSLETIDSEAFSDNNIHQLEIGTQLKTIGEFAFEGNNITTLIIPANVTEIKYDAFNDNPLQQVTFLHQEKNYFFDSYSFPRGTTLYFENIFSCPYNAAYYTCQFKNPVTGHIDSFSIPCSIQDTDVILTNKLHNEFLKIIKNIIKDYLNIEVTKFNHSAILEVAHIIFNEVIKSWKLDTNVVIDTLLKYENEIIKEAYTIDLLGLKRKTLKKEFDKLRTLKLENKEKEITETPTVVNIPTIPSNKNTSIIEYFVLIRNELSNLPEEMCIKIEEELEIIKEEYLTLKNPIHISSDIDLIYRLEKILISIIKYKKEQNKISLYEIIEQSKKPILILDDYYKLLYQISNFENNIHKIDDIENIITITQNFVKTINQAVNENIITQDLIDQTLNEKYKKLIIQASNKIKTLEI